MFALSRARTGTGLNLKGRVSPAARRLRMARPGRENQRSPPCVALHSPAPHKPSGPAGATPQPPHLLEPQQGAAGGKLGAAPPPPTRARAPAPLCAPVSNPPANFPHESGTVMYFPENYLPPNRLLLHLRREYFLHAYMLAVTQWGSRNGSCFVGK